jgi:hypothetical protein
MNERKRKKMVSVLPIIGCVLLMIAILTLTTKTCKAEDTSSFDQVSGVVSTNFQHAYGDNTNGGYANIAGEMCGMSQGDTEASFDGTGDGTAEGAFDANLKTSASKAELIFTGKATNQETGESSIQSQASAEQASFVGDNSNANWYVMSGQGSNGTFTADVATDERELDFTGTAAAQGTTSFSKLEEDGHINVITDAQNTAKGQSSDTDGTNEANAGNNISGGAMLGNTIGEFNGSAEITNSPNTAWTKGHGEVDISQTATTTGFKIRANVNVKQQSGQ